jgi:hypothetical protein
MTKKIALYIVLHLCFFGFSQKSNEQFPTFPSCENKQPAELEQCFYNEIQTFVFNNFEVSNNLPNDYKGVITTIFEVTDKGNFKIIYIDSNQKLLKEETQRVFNLLPKIKPATYNDRAIYSKFTIKIAIPLQNPAEKNEIDSAAKSKSFTFDKNQELTEIDSIIYKKFDNPKYTSHLNIPFSHSYYAQFDVNMNIVGANNHTASKPYTYTEVNKYYSLKTAEEKLYKNKTSWWGKKLWNENTVGIQGEDYWFTMNPILDLQLGKSTKSTFINTRGIQINGGVGSNLNFTTTIYESQARFADYYNQYANSIKPSGGNPAIIPGIGIAKEFKTDAYDIPSAEANITFAPSKYFDLQLGYGRNFIGDGYRSILMSDGASPYPYFKINSKFWKIKYTNLYMWMKDVRDTLTIDRTYATKYAASHYLSWNVSKRVNVGFFESVVWTNKNNRGFDFSFVNPIIFYRSVEFGSSSKSGNALLGITTKYKWNSQFNFYRQFLLDEFSLGDMKNGDNSWRNKFAYQLGAKYYNAFNIQNLLLQIEYNHIRPYVYSHSEVITNYGHNNQSLGHQWGGNAKEILTIARYYKGRYFANAKLQYGIRGLDFNTTADSYNYGSNIYLDYDQDRYADTNVKTGQGNTTNVLIADLQAGYLINPQTNLKLFGNLLLRNLSPKEETDAIKKGTTTWFSIGIRCDIFNWYFDY